MCTRRAGWATVKNTFFMHVHSSYISLQSDLSLLIYLFEAPFECFRVFHW
jgi:hypothetical protein